MIQCIAEFPCPNCQHRLRVKHEHLGKKLRCKYCAHEFPTAPGNDILAAAPESQALEREGQMALQQVATLEEELQTARDELASRTEEYAMAAQRFQEAEGELSRLQDHLQQRGRTNRKWSTCASN